MMKRTSIMFFVLLLILLIIPLDELYGKELLSFKESIEFEEVKAVNVIIAMGAGKLIVNGGADKLMEGSFTYASREIKPEIKYTVTGNRGELIIREPDISGFKLIKKSYNWDIKFNDDIPMELEVQLGAGKSNLKLSDLEADNVDVETGAGDVDIDLRGKWNKNIDVSISCGLGQVTLYLPEDFGVIVDVGKGLGIINASNLEKHNDKYINSIYDKSEFYLDIDVDVGIGEINLIVED